MYRAISGTIPYIGQEEYSLFKDNGTRNSIIMVRMVLERTIETHVVYLSSIEYAKASDKVGHKGRLEMLGNLDIFRKEIRIIQNQ